MFPLQDITIYHKTEDGYIRYTLEASFRDTTTETHSRNGYNSTDNALIRIFDIDDYNVNWFVNKEDIIVNQSVDYEIEKNAITELQALYGKNNVYRVMSVDKFIFDDEELKDLNHVKLGCK